MTHCSECGEARVRTPSGYVCPNGHGRIVPREKAEKRAKAEELAPLPKAHEIEGVASTRRGYSSRKRFRLVDPDGKLLEGVWAILDRQVPHAVRARTNGNRRWFERDTLIEREVLRAMGVERPEFSVPREQ